MADEAGIRARWLKKLAERRKLLAVARGAHNKALESVRAAKRVLGRHPVPKPPVKKQVWHPGAIRDVYGSAGPFVTGRPKLVWHTTEGGSLPNYGTGSAPHFTLDPRSGKLWQHIPVNESAKSLRHPTGTPETNRARAIQVELIGRAAETQDWPDAWYAEVAKLARWIETNAGVPRACGLTFSSNAKKLTGQGFVDYTGHCGHQHVPGNDHTDPGRFRINEVI